MLNVLFVNKTKYSLFFMIDNVIKQILFIFAFHIFTAQYFFNDTLLYNTLSNSNFLRINKQFCKLIDARTSRCSFLF